MERPPAVPAKYRVLASLVPFLAVAAIFGWGLMFHWRGRAPGLDRERKARALALPILERARERVERAEKYARLAQPELEDVRSTADQADQLATRVLELFPADVPSHPEEAYRIRGRALELLYRFEEARSDYETCLRLNPETPARYHLGLLGLRELARARLVGMKTSLADAETMAGRASEPLRRFQAPAYEIDLKDESEVRLSSMCNLAVAYAFNDFAGAERSARLASEADPTEWIPHYVRGLSLYELKKPADAARALEDAVRTAPAIADPHAALAVLHRELGRRTDAIAELGTAIEADEHFLEAYLLRGTILFEDGRHAEARVDFSNCVKLRNLPDVQFRFAIAAHESWLGSGRSDAGALEAAEKALGAYVEARPKETEGWLRRARVRLARGNADGAAADLARVFEISPSLPDAMEALGDVHDARKRWDDAEKAYSAAIGKSGDPARVASVLRKRARARAAGGRLDGALADLDALLSRDPGDAGLIHDKVKLQADAGRLDDALATLQRALETPRAGVRLRVLRAEILTRKGDTAGAIREATAAYDADPLLAEALVARGRAFLAAGNKPEAAADFEKALLIRADLKAELEPLLRQARP